MNQQDDKCRVSPSRFTCGMSDEPLTNIQNRPSLSAMPPEANNESPPVKPRSASYSAQCPATLKNDWCPEIETVSQHTARSLPPPVFIIGPKSKVPLDHIASAEHMDFRGSERKNGIDRNGPPSSGLINSLETPEASTDGRGSVISMSLNSEANDNMRRGSRQTTPSETSSTQAETATHPGIFTIHDICLHATQVYISRHRVNWIVRQGTNTVSLQDIRENTSRRRRLAGGFRLDRVHTAGTPVATPDIPMPTDSLLTNTSSICTMVWERALRERQLMMHTERIALDNMAALLEWADTIVWHDVVNSNTEDFARLLSAARNICAWVGDEEGLELLERMEFY
jgi:galactitol-specific phosphotransferase system IIB component